jgi:hypothetical protein
VVLALGFLGQFVEEGLGAGSVLAVDQTLDRVEMRCH